MLAFCYTTERPEEIDTETLRLVGTESKMVYDAMNGLLINYDEYHQMAEAINSNGEGTTSFKILNAIQASFNSDRNMLF